MPSCCALINRPPRAAFSRTIDAASSCVEVCCMLGHGLSRSHYANVYGCLCFLLCVVLLAAFVCPYRQGTRSF